MLTRRRVLHLAAAAPLVTLARPLHAAEPAVFQRDGLAIGGTDPVAYRAGNGPVQGLRDLAYDWMGATWTFATEENRTAFIADPEALAPAFGGYCAWAAARGYLAPTVPEAWDIEQDRLFLNANLRTHRRWRRQLPGIIAEADANWPAILG